MLKESKEWRVSYRGIAVKAVNWHESEFWNGYIMFNSQQLAVESAETLAPVSDVAPYGFRFDEAFIHSNWGNNDGVVSYKFGWDYMHHGQFTPHSHLVVIQDALKVVDALWQNFPHIKVFCKSLSGWHNVYDGVWIQHPKSIEFISNAGINWRSEQGWQVASVLPSHPDEFEFMRLIRESEKE